MLSTAQARHKAGRLPEIQRIEILQKLADLVAAEHEDFSRLIVVYFFHLSKKNFNHLILGIDNKNLSITDLSFF
jgi:acyl-CoA reductase-like NAD-dependent aldehyde dehydrogenase